MSESRTDLDEDALAAWVVDVAERLAETDYGAAWRL
jgi:uncharacterized protein YllA (UPF0747 family)